MTRRRIAALAALTVVAAAPRARAVKCPNVMLVLDRSGSMEEDPNGVTPAPKGKSKWELLQAAVQNIVMAYGDQLPFGLEMYTSGAFDDASCYADARIDVEPDHDTAQAILNKVLKAKPDSGTNTGEAIRRAAEDPVMNDASRGQYIILITDGDPNCNSGDLSNAAYTIKQIQNAAAKGIKTFVVGFDGTNGVKPANLNKMAQAGGEPRMMGCGAQNNPCYYSAQSAQTLNEALMNIITVVTGGEFGMTTCDDSCFANGCDPGQVCTTDEQNPKPHCVPDPCGGAVCNQPNTFCRGGQCVAACTTPCAQGDKCIDGQCIPDVCHGVVCGAGLYCDPLSGSCLPDPCVMKSCKSPGVCDPNTGTCGLDPCRTITCPARTLCVAGGNCEAYYGDGGVAPPTQLPGGRRSGCDVAPAGTSQSGWELALGLALVLGVLVHRLRRRAG